MMRLLSAASIVAAFSFCAVCDSVSGAEPSVDPKVREAVKSIVVANWTKTADGLAKSEAAHRAAKVASPSDVRIDYALALMQMRYLRFEEADKTLVAVLAKDADQLDARRLRIRLAAQMKKHTTALEEIDHLSERLATVNDPQRTEDRRDGVAFLGKMFEFYQSPAVKGLAPTAVPDALAKVTQRFSATDQAAFSGGDAPAATASGAEPAKTDVATTPAAPATGDPAKQAADAETKVREQIARIDALLAPIDAEMATLNTNGTSVQAEVTRLDGQVRTLLTQAEATDDPCAEELLRGQANMQLAQLRNLQGQLQQITLAANKLKSRRTTLTQERRVQITRYENDMKRLGVAPASFNEPAAAAPAAAPATGLSTGLATTLPTSTPLQPAAATPATSAPATAAASLGSFIDLSLEPEKQRLLKAVGL